MKSLAFIENFGSVDADNDELLYRCFQDHEAYQDVVGFKKFLIIGKKGSGKTAIFKKMVTDNGPNYFCFGHTFSDYPWQFHEKQSVAKSEIGQKYVLSWKYLILMTFSKILLNNDASQPWSTDGMILLDKLEKFVVDSYGTRNVDVTQIFTPSKSLKVSPHLSVDISAIKAKLGLDIDRLPIEYLPLFAFEVVANIQNTIIKAVNPENNYHICFDQLDIGFDPNSQEYRDKLIGLLLAAKSINDAFKIAGKRASIVIFLRSDIYEVLQFEDKNKITENSSTLIEWDTPRARHSLRDLMGKRFTALLQGSDVEIVGWNDVFDETKEMPGRQKKFKYILEHTYLRPRDVIRYCNTVLAVYKTGDNMPAKFTSDNVIDAKSDYSDYFLREIDDEIHKHLPEYNKCLDLIREIGTLKFEKNDFVERYKMKIDNNPARAEMALCYLYEYNLVGYYRPGGIKGGSEYIYKYKDVRARYDNNATVYKVHNGLVETLKLKRNVTRISDDVAVDEDGG